MNKKLSTGTYVFYIDIDEIDKNNGYFETGVKYTMRVNVHVTATADTMAYIHTLHILHVNRSAGGTRRFFEVILTDDGLKARVINLLINYKNEPAINLTIGFADNTYNYSLIAKSQFGTTFGAENRVFLAGNPSFKHVDRYNISNDLLGNNQKSQSYELSYFPSKNYRVVGGDYSAINGYVVATDTQLYVTKEFAINDSCLYIRTREINDSGVVSFFEYKTNINKTPINNRCIVNFYNDVVMLTKDGLLAIEISSNVLTNERLLKLRSGFINGQLKADIKENPMPFCIEDNERLYMVIGKNIYVADARYVDTNENSKIDNVSYEIVKWQVGVSLYNAFNSENGIVFYDTSRKYYLQNTGYDKLYYIFKDGEIVFGWEIIDGTPEDVFINENVYNYLHDNDLLEINTENYCYIKAIDGNDISWSAGSGLVQFSVSVDNIAQIENLTENVISELDIYVYTDNGFEIITDFSGDLINVIGATVLYGIVIDWKNKPLYIWKEDVPGEIKLKLRPFDKEKNSRWY